MTVAHGPDFRADRLGELSVVRDDEDTTLKVLERGDEGGKRLAVEVVGGLVETDDVGSSPGGGTEDDLDLLSTGQTAHRVVRNELGLETTPNDKTKANTRVDSPKVLKVLLNLATDERAHETETLGLPRVELHDLLLKATANQLVTREPHVLGRRHALERHLVLVRLLELLAGDNLVDDPLDALLDDGGALLHLLELLLGHDAARLVHLLEVLTGLVTPEHVLERGRVEVVVDVVEGVLGDVTNDQVGVLPDGTALVGLGLAGEQLDEGRLSGTVGTQNGHTRRERDLERDVVQLLDGRGRVLVRDVTHLEQGLLLGLDTVEKRRGRELELVVLGNVELEVGLGLGDVDDKVGQVARVALELEVVEVEDVGDGAVEEVRVVRDNDRRAGGERGEVVDEPVDVEDVEMVGGLVEEENVGLEQDGTSESQLHLPTARERADRVLLLLLVETDRLEGGSDLGLGGEQTLVAEDPVDDRDLGLGAVYVVLDVEGSDLGRGREAVDLVVDDGVHERRLARTVSATETVSVTTLETHRGVVEQDLGAVGQVELLNVAQVLTLLLVGKLDVVGFLLVGLLLEKLADGGERVKAGQSQLEVRRESSLPGGLVVQVRVDEGRREDTGVEETGVGLLDGGAAVLLDKGDEVGGEVVALGDAERGEVGTVRLGGDLADAAEGGDGPVADGSRLGVGNGLGRLDETGKELGEERSDSVLRVDELGHVVGNDADLALGGGRALIETSDEQGRDEGDGRGGNLGNESGGGKKGDGLGDLLDGVKERLDESGDELFNVLVLDEGTGLFERDLGGLLDVGLGVPDGLGEDGDQVGHGSAHLLGRRGDELLQDVEAAGLDLPLAGGLDLDQERGQEDKRGPGVHGLDNGLDGGEGRVLGAGNLVGKVLEEDREGRVDVGRDDVGLDELGGAVLAQGGDDAGTGLAGGGRLLVGQSL
ncbi:LOW QUALITY PROTEIN: hypothetical protein JCM24511_03108 [Saitozyma sp. JCM 24511]|nr:LOW QUALITY PROTEIN: hypothetical protein JCM24511_03108 [Saitozyma sp. JCM 24511]